MKPVRTPCPLADSAGFRGPPAVAAVRAEWRGALRTSDLSSARYGKLLDFCQRRLLHISWLDPNCNCSFVHFVIFNSENKREVDTKTIRRRIERMVDGQEFEVHEGSPYRNGCVRAANSTDMAGTLALLLSASRFDA